MTGSVDKNTKSQASIWNVFYEFRYDSTAFFYDDYILLVQQWIYGGSKFFCTESCV